MMGGDALFDGDGDCDIVKATERRTKKVVEKFKIESKKMKCLGMVG